MDNLRQAQLLASIPQADRAAVLATAAGLRRDLGYGSTAALEAAVTRYRRAQH